MFIDILMMLVTALAVYVAWRSHRSDEERICLMIRSCGLHHVIVYNPAPHAVQMGKVSAERGIAVARKVEGCIIPSNESRRFDVSLALGRQWHPFAVRVRCTRGRYDLILVPIVRKTAPQKAR